MTEPARYAAASRVEQVLDWLVEFGPRARIVAGATDLLRVPDERSRPSAELWIDTTRIAELDHITESGDAIRLGALATHSQILRSPLVVRAALPLAQACLDLGTPQVRNRGTLAGSIASAHADSDPIPALIALGASARLRSAAGRREAPVAALTTPGAIRPDEMIVEIVVPKPAASERSLFAKHRARRGVGVATVNLAVVLDFAADASVTKATLVTGGGSPVVVPGLPLVGRALDAAGIEETARMVVRAARPFDDVRASADYRRAMLEVLVRRALRTLRDREERARWPSRPVALWAHAGEGRSAALEDPAIHATDAPIVATVNGSVREAVRAGNRTLLDWLREGLGLTGAKNGCGEGVCGACTVQLDGLAVAACLVPAERAHGATIRTVEGLAADGKPDRLQRAFVECNAIQCGFCTPGFLMAGTALLGDSSRPSPAEIEAALAGNLCRCTGYRAIAGALERAAEEPDDREV